MALAVLLFAYRRQLPALELGDAVCCGAPIGLLLGRIANFVNGELFGRVSDLPWAVVFPHGGPDPRHPSQIYEAMLEGVVLLCVLAWFARGARAPGSDGRLFGIFLLGYGLARSFAELFREPDAHLGFLLGGLTMGQILSLPMIALGIFLIARSYVRARRLERA